MGKFDLTAIKKTVCIFAHPDDESFGPSGTIAKLAESGEIFVICITDGNAANGPKSLGKIRKKELLSASKVLGVKDVFFLGYNDGELNNNLYHEVTKKIQSIVNRVRPDTLLTFEPRGVSGHIDHVFASMVTSFIYRESLFIKRLFYYFDSYRINKFVKKYFIFHPNGIADSEADLLIDVSDVQKQKESAIKCHVSQAHDGKWILLYLGLTPKREVFQIIHK